MKDNKQIKQEIGMTGADTGRSNSICPIALSSGFTCRKSGNCKTCNSFFSYFVSIYIHPWYAGWVEILIIFVHWDMFIKSMDLNANALITFLSWALNAEEVFF